MAANQLIDSVVGGDGIDTIRIDADGFAIIGADLWARASSVEVLAAGSAGTGKVDVLFEEGMKTLAHGVTL